MKTIILILTICFIQIGMSQEIPKMIEIKFEGKYSTGRAPCEWLPDGSRRWRKTTGFEITKMIESNLKIAYVEINYVFDENQGTQLKSGQEYLVTMKLTEERITELKLDKANTIMTYWNPIKNDEIMKIEKKLD